MIDADPRRNTIAFKDAYERHYRDRRDQGHTRDLACLMAETDALSELDQREQQTTMPGKVEDQLSSEDRERLIEALDLVAQAYDAQQREARSTPERFDRAAERSREWANSLSGRLRQGLEIDLSVQSLPEDDLVARLRRQADVWQARSHNLVDRGVRMHYQSMVQRCRQQADRLELEIRHARGAIDHLENADG